MQNAFRVYEEYCIMRRVLRYSIFRSSGIQEGRRWIYAIDREVSRPRSTSDSSRFRAFYDFIESDNTSYHVRADATMNIFHTEQHETSDTELH